MSNVIIKNEQTIYSDMLNNIDDKYEKSVGNLTADLTKSNAIELAELYLIISRLIGLIDVDNLSGDLLAKYVKQRKGIIKNLATNAKVVCTIEGKGNIHVGDLVSTQNNIQFQSLENKFIDGGASINFKCTEPGSIGMVGANSITQFPITLSGLTAVTNSDASFDGFDEETDESLRERYYTAVREGITSNNQAHFKKWAKEYQGVGNAKTVIPYPIPQTIVQALSIDVYIIDDNMLPASELLIENVQNYIDPKGVVDSEGHWSTWGMGLGQSSLGNYCTVKSATKKGISINTDVVILAGYTKDEVKNNITNKIEDYLKEIAFKQTYVSYAKIGSIILGVDGVGDWTTLKINNTTSNVYIENTEVAVLTDVVLM